MAKYTLSPIFLAQMNNDIAAIKKMVQQGVDINTKDHLCRTLLMYAVTDNQLDLVNELIKLGIDVNAQDKQGFTALHVAAIYQNVKIAKCLVAHGAILEAKDGWGNTPLQRAVFYSKGKGDVIKFLLKKGANRNSKNNYGISPLSLAENIGNYNVKQFFEK